jgi:predicted dehydrogenase
MMSGINRREFLKRGAAGVAVAPWVIPGAVRGAVTANERIGIGLIGRGTMGSGHLNRLVRDPGVQLLAVCDVDATRRDAGKQAVEAAYAADRASGSYAGCAAYNDYRELLARKDIDAVVIVTPDHWHALQSIDAARAGKDVYCEKPISMTLDESRKIVDTVRRYGRVFQTGTQYRSIPQIRQVCRFVRNGGLGKIKSVFTVLDPVYGFIKQERVSRHLRAGEAELYRNTYTPVDLLLPPEPVPAGLDWEMWVGPAPYKSYNSAYHINPMPGVVPWSFADAFGVVSSTWHLSHSVDVIQWALGQEESGPVEIIHPASGQYPTMTCRYSNGTLLHFVDHWGMVKDVYHAVPADARLAGLFGGIFVGERGWLTSMTTGGPIEGGPEAIFHEMGMVSREVNSGANDHHANWFQCIRTRQRPSCQEEIGHRTASVGHLAMISYKLGRSLQWDPVNEVFPGDEAANRLRSRAMREPWKM